MRYKLNFGSCRFIFVSIPRIRIKNGRNRVRIYEMNGRMFVTTDMDRADQSTGYGEKCGSRFLWLGHAQTYARRSHAAAVTPSYNTNWHEPPHSALRLKLLHCSTNQRPRSPSAAPCCSISLPQPIQAGSSRPTTATPDFLCPALTLHSTHRQWPFHGVFSRRQSG